ncbi:MAG: ATP-dependent Clp protease ATP-binding subunit [Clostridia bacterium]|nr:ATP-dependent Clp protease ATP-binding subunit [Clostridia bacterium]
MNQLCYRCKKRPAVVFIQGMSQNGDKVGEGTGLCLICAKEAGIQPINDMLKNFNISDEEIEAMSEQFMGMMNPEEMGLEPSDDSEDAFSPGGAATFPFLNGIFGNMDKAGKPDSAETEADDKKSKKKKGSKRKFISQFCTDLTAKARNGELDVIIGRDAELYRTIQILSRRTKNNPCLIGEPGVGKTAIAEGLALKIASKDAPAKLLDKEIMLLDLTGLVAGTQFRGQFESRIKGLIDEVKSEGNIILFIDEVHNLVGAGDSEGSMSAGNILKPALSRGEIQVIGATTFKEYRKYIEKDAALERRFQPVTVEEPSIEESVKMLKGIKGYYEGYHNVKVSDDIVRSAVLLSERYINDRFLPDKAIDLLDEACACACLRNKAIDELFLAEKQVNELTSELTTLEAEVESPDYERIANVKFELEKAKTNVEKAKPKASKNKVTSDDLARVIELWTGVPAAKVKQNNLEKLSSLEDNIKKHIIGQDEAVEAVVLGVRRSSVQISSHRRPASFIFVGPTGVGKTELVKVLAKEMFNTPDALIRLDMSEFMEKHAVSKLIGAPPGYVGYDEAGQLTEKVRRKPYSVILFDEIEKAHPDILNILLQILDDGRITDSQGRTVNFENTVLVMTSNAGSDNNGTLLGFNKTVSEASKDKAMKALKDFLRPEFLGRVDDIIAFEPLSKDSLEKIAALILDELKPLLLERDIEFEYDSNLCSYFANKCDGRSGARELRKMIRKEVEDKIIGLLIDNPDVTFESMKAECDGDVKISYQKI